MSRRYTPEERARVIKILRTNNNDVARTHLQTGIPHRTLYTWRKESLSTYKPAAAAEKTAPLPPPPQTEFSESDADLSDQELINLRVRLKRQLDALIQNDRNATPREVYFLSLAAARLMDVIDRINHVIPVDDSTVNIIYTDLDGSVHSNPPWERDSLIDDNTNDPDDTDGWHGQRW